MEKVGIEKGTFQQEYNAKTDFDVRSETDFFNYSIHVSGCSRSSLTKTYANGNTMSIFFCSNMLLSKNSRKCPRTGAVG